VGEPGTVVHFFTSVYAPEVLARCTVGSRSEHERTLRQLRHCYGRDLRLEELGRDVVTRFTAWLFEAGKKPQTVRNERGRFLAVWRYAAELDRAPTPPKFRRLKIPRESPDAWSLDEVGRLIDAAGRLERKPIAGIPVGPYLRAMLLVCWYSALRRSSLVRIRMCDVDLEGARLYVPADRIKNCCGQGFRLGPDAIAAVRTIWDSGRELLFPPPADMTLLNRLFAMALRTADVAQRRRLNNSHFHKLRRSVATHTASRAGLAAATALLGHSTAELLKRYIDPSYMTGTDATAWLPPIGQREERFSGQDKS
jgi:integrase